MARLHLIRHGLAGPLGQGEYDVLSDQGEAQATALGRWFAESKLAFGAVYVGPRVRQQRTHQAAEKAAREGGVIWPPMRLVDAFDEHAGETVFRRALTELRGQVGELDAIIARVTEATPSFRVINAAYRDLSRLWATGRIPPELGEGFVPFRRRVEAALASVIEQLRAQAKLGLTVNDVAVFTSAGVIAAAVGQALKLDDLQTLELSFAVENCSTTEFLFSSTSKAAQSGLTLWRFNSVAGLPPSLLTSL